MSIVYILSSVSGKMEPSDTLAAQAAQNACFSVGIDVSVRSLSIRPLADLFCGWMVGGFWSRSRALGSSSVTRGGSKRIDHILLLHIIKP